MPALIIVGAGVTGLTLGHELARRGEEVILVESCADVGGLARTFRYGEFFFDVGPHRFHTDDREVAAFVASALGAELLEIPRASAVRAFGHTYAWPLRPGVLASLPPSLMLHAARDLLRRERTSGDSFEAEIIGRYGRALYEAFFGPYTARFLGLSPDRVHRDWARASVDRAVIDRRVRAGGLLDLLRGALLPAPVSTTFGYPAHGVGQFAERLADGFVANGGRLLLGRPVTGIEASTGRIEAIVAGGERLPADGVVWTAPITAVSRLLGLPDSGLRFLSTVLYNVELRIPSRLGHQWVYLAEEEAFLRVSDPVSFSPAAAPPGRGALCVERTCREGDTRWRDAERHVPEVIEGLVRNGFLRSAADVAEVHVERVADTYPVYSIDYTRALRRSLDDLATYRNLLLAGRSGRFWYNNMDHGIAQALQLARAILGVPTGSRVLAAMDVGELQYWRVANGARAQGGDRELDSKEGR